MSTSTLSPTRRALLAAVKRLGEADAGELAAAAGVTPAAVRQHLTPLLRQGYVVRREEPGPGRGRPRHRYSLTRLGHELFPTGYAVLANDLLGHLDDIDSDLVAAVFERRRQQRVDRAKVRLAAAGPRLDRRVAELARILDEDGYIAEAVPLDDGDGWAIVEHHCAIFDVAARYGTACATELDFLREVLPDAEVRRVTHILSGDPRCAYEINAR